MTDASTYKQKQPQYSMTARNELPGDGTRKPGPGAYRPEKVSYDSKLLKQSSKILRIGYKVSNLKIMNDIIVSYFIRFM